MNKDTKSTKLQSLLRKSGFKATSSRLSVLNLLEKAKRPLSAKGIIESLKNEMDQATVYRIVTALKKKGLIRQIDLRHNHAHYEIFRNDEHHHLICMYCGLIEDVNDCELESMHDGIIKHSKRFFEVKQHALEFYGICKTCAIK